MCVFTCFPAGTPVATKDGLRPIEEIEMGDWVYAYNEKTGETKLRQVLGTVQREVDAIVEISLGEEKIRTTPEHPFYINGQWKAAGELEVGEMATTMVQEQAIAGQTWEEKKPLEIKENSILVEGVTYHTDKKEKVYNFEVEGWHTYFVGWLRVLVHNAKVCVKAAKQAYKATVGWIDNAVRGTNYRNIFFKKNPSLKGKVWVHHAIEKQAMDLFPDRFFWNEIHSLENLRGIPKEINSELHLSKIRKAWDRFYRGNPNATREQILEYASELDKKYGNLFDPPIF